MPKMVGMVKKAFTGIRLAYLASFTCKGASLSLIYMYRGYSSFKDDVVSFHGTNIIIRTVQNSLKTSNKLTVLRMRILLT